MTEQADVKTKGTVGFQLAGADLIRFEKMVERLDVDKSELAREAFLCGLHKAEQRIRTRRIKEIESTLRGLKKSGGAPTRTVWPSVEVGTPGLLLQPSGNC